MPKDGTATVPFPLKRRVVGNYASLVAGSDFVWALSWLKHGKAKMRRKNWIADKFVHLAHDDLYMGYPGQPDVLWRPTGKDLFAEDWELCP